MPKRSMCEARGKTASMTDRQRAHAGQVIMNI